MNNTKTIWKKTVWNLLFYNTYKNKYLNCISNYATRKNDVSPRDHILSYKQVNTKWVIPPITGEGVSKKIFNQYKVCIAIIVGWPPEI